MDAPPTTWQNEPALTTAVNPTSSDPNPTVDILPESNSTTKATMIKKEKEKEKKKKAQPHIDVSVPPQSSTSSQSSSCTSSSHTVLKGLRVSRNRRNPRVMLSSVRQKQSDVEALALPLGMSIAAFVAQVLERKDAAGKRMSVDHLSEICTLAVRESLATVFGDKFDCFVSNFEKSFQSTLMTLRLISESSKSNGEQLRNLTKEISSELTAPMPLGREGDSRCNSGVSESQSEAIWNTISSQQQLSMFEENEEDMQTGPLYRELALHCAQTSQQLSCVSPNTLHSGINQSMFSTLEKSVMEQARSNDLKTFEIGLLMRRMRLKETQLALNCDSNILERFKLSMGISKASFKAEKFKNELEETKHAELLKKCIDCLVAGMLIMLACLAYGTYVYSHQRITEATMSCTPTKESNSWWMPKPVSSFNSGLQILRCQVQVISRMLFGGLMILVIAYLLIQRSASSKQSMPVTFILLLLGLVCGFAGKFCVDTLGGSGYHWLFYWEVLCLLHFFSNACTSALFLILHGPIAVSEMSKGVSKLLRFPYWMRRFLFYATVLMFLPLLCGLVPFAGPGEWKRHFSSLVTNHLLLRTGTGME